MAGKGFLITGADRRLGGSITRLSWKYHAYCCFVDDLTTEREERGRYSCFPPLHLYIAELLHTRMTLSPMGPDPEETTGFISPSVTYVPSTSTRSKKHLGLRVCIAALAALNILTLGLLFLSTRPARSNTRDLLYSQMLLS